MNIWIGSGRLTKDPMLSESKKYIDITLAVDDFVYGEKSVQFIPVRFVGESNLKRVLTYLHKGSKIMISGKLTRQKSKTDQNTWYVTIITNTFEFAESKSDIKPKDPVQEKFMEIPDGLADDGMPFT